jgi:hypothetical protein
MAEMLEDIELYASSACFMYFHVFSHRSIQFYGKMV